ncbi:hypothetical protein KBZ10_27510 [Streptomyces sp. F63]|uniref:hypothetical protein n=1 Tax=Streptomyces sp. F63 TaxID=2824887 RepID=UPI001B36CED2|nr:hypothetical protein [Streptomyces sp. F63]MBQ0988192.1 hypothetical protein [Streptomyces sp. F63]
MRLLDDVYSFAATGPRTPAGWQKDALAVMNREVGDPRGWITLDWDKERDGEPAKNSPSFPFVPLSDTELTRRLSPVTAETAARLLVITTYEWGPPGTEEETRAASADARTLLDRFGDRISCYSNITEARTTPSPDLTTGVTGWNPLTEYDGDFGVIVVSPEEVGVFWSFNPI